MINLSEWALKHRSFVIYLMIASLLIFAILMWSSSAPAAPGRLFWEYLTLYGVARAVIETFMDSPRVVGGLTLAQAASIVVAVVSFVFWWLAGRGTAVGATTDPAGAPKPVDPQD